MKLKECPHCGEPECLEIVLVDPDQPDGKKLVLCYGCETQGPHADTPDEAARLWGTRPREEALVKGVKEARERLADVASALGGARRFMPASGKHIADEHVDDAIALLARLDTLIKEFGHE